MLNMHNANTTLDLSNLTNNIVSSEQDFAAKALQLGFLLEKFGFCWIEGHGIPQEKIKNLAAECNSFFSRPEKAVFRKPSNSLAYHGYNSVMDLSGEKIYREYFHYHPYSPINYEHKNHLVQPIYDAIEGTLPQLNNLAKTVLEMLELLLGTKPGFFLDKHCGLEDKNLGSHTYLAAINYPPMGPDVRMLVGKGRMGQHTDWDTFTILLIDPVGGLEAKTPDGKLVRVDPPMKENDDFGVLLIIGDYLETWSCGRFKATPHRVPIPEGSLKQKARLGLPYFILPDNDVTICPLVDGIENDKERCFKAGQSFEDNMAIVYKIPN